MKRVGRPSKTTTEERILLAREAPRLRRPDALLAFRYRTRATLDNSPRAGTGPITAKRNGEFSGQWKLQRRGRPSCAPTEGYFRSALIRLDETAAHVNPHQIILAGGDTKMHPDSLAAENDR